MKHFAFRLEANSHIGTGHLMRCMAIANELFKNGSSCHFICSELSSSLQALLKSHGHNLDVVENEDRVLSVLEGLNPEYLIVDHYGLDARFERKANVFCKYILAIDDLANRSHHCDFLLDQGPLRNKKDYRQWVNCDCQFFLGTDYVLIRPEFRKLRKSDINSWSKGLISLGGSDPNNITLTILKELESLIHLKDIKWTVIAGIANSHWNDLKHFTNHSRLDITLIKQSDQIAEIMSNHDFAIGAAGVMSWERACIGLPSLVIPIEDNQQLGIEVIKHFCLGEILEVPELSASILGDSLDRLQYRANDYLRHNQAMVDGLGVE